MNGNTEKPYRGGIANSGGYGDFPEHMQGDINGNKLSYYRNTADPLNPAGPEEYPLILGKPEEIAPGVTLKTFLRRVVDEDGNKIGLTANYRIRFKGTGKRDIAFPVGLTQDSDGRNIHYVDPEELDGVMMVGGFPDIKTLRQAKLQIIRADEIYRRKLAEESQKKEAEDKYRNEKGKKEETEKVA